MTAEDYLPTVPNKARQRRDRVLFVLFIAKQKAESATHDFEIHLFPSFAMPHASFRCTVVLLGFLLFLPDFQQRTAGEKDSRPRFWIVFSTTRCVALEFLLY